MKYRVNTVEKWTNSYVVEAESEKEAESKVLDGSLGIDYFPLNDSKLAKPRTFIGYLEAKVYGKE